MKLGATVPCSFSPLIPQSPKLLQPFFSLTVASGPVTFFQRIKTPLTTQVISQLRQGECVMRSMWPGATQVQNIYSLSPPRTYIVTSKASGCLQTLELRFSYYCWTFSPTLSLTLSIFFFLNWGLMDVRFLLSHTLAPTKKKTGLGTNKSLNKKVNF